MQIKWEKVRIYIKPGKTDMRKQINSLSAMVQNELKLDVFTGHLFVFCGRRRKRIKILYWDQNGFCLWQKQLVKHRFPWPKTDEEAREITKGQLDQILTGIDFWNAHQTLTYKTA